MEQVTLNVQMRNEVSKKERNKFKKEGLIPAIFYGKHIEKNIPLSVDAKLVKKIIKSGSGINTFINLEINKGKETLKYLSLIKDVQIHPIYRMPVHVDFYAIEEKEELEVDVAVTVKGVSPGVKKGGILQIIRKELTVKCLPADLPERIEIDISTLDYQDAIHIEDIHLPNVKFIYDKNFTVVTVLPPSKVEEEVVEEEVVEEETEE